jgi:hypothetical protein
MHQKRSEYPETTSIPKPPPIPEKEAHVDKREVFRPRIWAETEIEPHNVISGFLAKKLKQIKLPREKLPEGEIEYLVREHYRNLSGICAGFGKIKRYRYEFEQGRRAYFDYKGKRLNTVCD